MRAPTLTYGDIPALLLVFRYNIGQNCDGAGIRLGGHVIDGFTYGVNNNVSFARLMATPEHMYLHLLIIRHLHV